MADGLQIQSDKALAGVEALIKSAAWYKRQFLVVNGVLKQLVEEAGEGMDDKAARQARRVLQDKLVAMQLAVSRAMKEEA